MTKTPLQNVIDEAARCLNCAKAPCKKACPLSNDVPAITCALKNGEVEKAGSIVAQTNPFGAICGVVCPHEKQCQGACVLNAKGKPINVGYLEEFAYQYGFDGFAKLDNSLEGKSVAVVGSGVAGITCAVRLAQRGARVRVFDKEDVMGGVVQHEIPRFRLNHDHIVNLIQAAKQIGVGFVRNVCVGKRDGYMLADLSAQYDAVFVATGLTIDSTLGIEGEHLDGVVYGKQFLTNAKVGSNVVVIGGGNVAMDCARTATRLGAKVTIAYRRGYQQMPAFEKEKQDALAEGVEFAYLLSPHKINGNGAVESMTFEQMALGNPGADGRASIVPTGNTQTLACDTVIVATGSKLDTTVLNGTDIKVEKGRVVVDDNLNAGGNVFFGGDNVNREGTVVWAVKDGIKASDSITQFLKN